MFNCPECNHLISDLAKTCPNCGVELSTVLKNDRSNVKEENTKKGCSPGCLTFIILFIVIVILAKIFDSDSSYQSSSTSTNSTYVKTGSITELSNLYLGATIEDYKRVMQLLVAKDNNGIEQMLLNGEALYLSNNIKVKIISNGISYAEVRILSGIYTDQSAWIGSQFIE